MISAHYFSFIHVWGVSSLARERLMLNLYEFLTTSSTSSSCFVSISHVCETRTPIQACTLVAWYTFLTVVSHYSADWQVAECAKKHSNVVNGCIYKVFAVHSSSHAHTHTRWQQVTTQGAGQPSGAIWGSVHAQGHVDRRRQGSNHQACDQ